MNFFRAPVAWPMCHFPAERIRPSFLIWCGFSTGCAATKTPSGMGKVRFPVDLKGKFEKNLVHEASAKFGDGANCTRRTVPDKETLFRCPEKVVVSCGSGLRYYKQMLRCLEEGTGEKVRKGNRSAPDHWNNGVGIILASIAIFATGGGVIRLIINELTPCRFRFGPKKIYGSTSICET